MRRGRLRLIEASPRVDYETVRLLTQLQRAALRGEFQTAAVVTVSDRGECGSGYAGSDMRPFTVLGALDYLSDRIKDTAID